MFSVSMTYEPFYTHHKFTTDKQTTVGVNTIFSLDCKCRSYGHVRTASSYCKQRRKLPKTNKAQGLKSLLNQENGKREITIIVSVVLMSPE